MGYNLEYEINNKEKDKTRIIENARILKTGTKTKLTLAQTF